MRKIKIEIIRQMIEARGLSVRGAAKKMGIPQQTLQAWLTGQRVPKLDNIEMMARFFGVSVQVISDFIIVVPPDAARPDPREGEMASLFRLLDSHQKDIVLALVRDMVPAEKD